MHIRSKLTRYLAMLLAAVMTFCAVPMLAFAKDGEESPATVQTDAASTAPSSNAPSTAGAANTADTGARPSLAELFGDGEVEVTPLFELTERRDTYTKHVRMSDGTTVAAMYQKPVHIEEADGTFADIDNTLSEQGGEFSTPSTRIKLAKAITGNEKLYTLKDGSYKLTMSLIGAAKGTVGTVENSAEAEGETELSKMLSLAHLTSRVTYADILDGVDIEYVLDSLDIKENIIVKERAEEYSYTFLLELNGLTATLTADGAIAIADSTTGALVYTMPAPIVLDASGTIAPEGTAVYALSDSGNGKYTLTVTADPAWMLAEERVYPVTVDPTVGVPRMDILDVYVSDDAPTVAVEGDGLDLRHNTTVYIHVPSTYLPNIGRGSYVSEARLGVSGNNYGSTVTRVQAYEVTTPFTVTQNANGSYAFAGGARASTALDTIAFDKIYLTAYRFDITPVVRNRYDSEDGIDIALRATGLSASDSSYATVFQTEGLYDGFGVWPYLEVRYIEAAGLEDYYPTEAHSVGAAGSGSIQLAAGALTFLLPTLSTTDALMPVSLALVYNSTLAGAPLTYGSCDSGYTDAVLSYGFQLSLQQTLIMIPCSDKGFDGYYYIYKDEDGTEHYFKNNGNASGDYSGLGRSLEYDYDLGMYVLSYRGGTKKYFIEMTTSPSGTTAAWYLCKIEDANGNAVLIDVNSSYHPTAVRLAPAGKNEANAIEMLAFVYKNGILHAICNDITGDAVLLGYANTPTGAVTSGASKYLREVVYAHSDTVRGTGWRDIYTATSTVTVLRTTQLSYTENGCLSSVLDTESKRGMRYTWNGYRVTRVTEYSTGTGSELTGQSIAITTLTGFAEVRSAGADDILNNTDDILTRYTLDSLGRAVTVYSISVDGKTLYGATGGEYSTQKNAQNSLTHIIEGNSTVNLVIDGGFEKDFASHSYWTRNSADTVQQTSTIPAYQEQGSRTSVAFLPTTATPATITQALSLPSGEYAISFDTHSRSCADVVGTVYITNASTGAVLLAETVPLNADSVIAEQGRFTATFTVPKATASTTVLFSLTFTNRASTSPTILVDNVTLTAGLRASEFSLVQNGGFEPTALHASNQSAYPMSEFWTPGVTYDLQVSPDYALQGDGGLHIPSYWLSVFRYASQTVFTATAEELASFDLSLSRNFNEDTAFILSGFAKLTGSITATAPFRLRADVYYYQGEGCDDIVKSHYLRFNPEVTGWQYASMVVPTKYTPKSGEDGHYECIRRINVVCEFLDNNSAHAYFDNISFVPLTTQNSTSHYYHVNGQLAATKDQSSDTYYGYDTYGQLIRVANNHGVLIDYTYDENVYNRVLSETEYVFTANAGGTEYPYTAANPDALITKTKKSVTKYTYNAYGQCTKVVTNNLVSATSLLFWFDTEEQYVYTAYTYKEDDFSPFIGQLLTETDSYNNTVRYLYDYEDGKLLATVDAKGNATVYQYDSRNRLIGVRPGTYDSIYDTATADTSATAERVSYIYDTRGLLSEITTATTRYSFTYDTFGNTESTQVGGQTVASYEYYPNNGKLKKITYANGFSEEYVYTDLDRVAEIWYTDFDGVRTKAFAYAYTDEGQLLRFDDLLADEVTIYRYDSMGRLISAATSEADAYETYIDYTYDSFSSLQSMSYTVAYGAGQKHAVDYTYGYNDDRALSSIQLRAAQSSATVAYRYDGFQRLAQKTLTAGSFSNEVTLTYETTPKPLPFFFFEYPRTGIWVSSYTSTVNGTVANEYTYTYDKNGNITKITYADGKTVTYTYDDLNQLLTEVNEVIGRSYTFTYDNAGNRTSTAEVNFTTNTTHDTVYHTYDNDGPWGDALSTWRKGQWGYHTVDAIGNLTGIVTGADLSFDWCGRQLTAVYGSIFPEYYTYNDQGQRITRTRGDITTEYIYDGDRLIAEISPTEAMLFLYDEGLVPVGMQYRASTDTAWTTFWFEKNLHGDIVAVYSADGVKQLSYAYNAWGIPFATTYVNGTKAHKNPFLYRGYYYEQYLTLYRTQTRIYDPHSGRFVSPDILDVVAASPMALTDKNLYIYCDNNPVTRADPDGEFWHVIIGAAIGGIFEIGSQLISNGGSLADINWGKVAIATTVGAVTALCGPLSGAAISGIGNASNEIISQAECGEVNYGKTVIAFLVGAGASLIGYGVGKATSKIGGNIKINNLSKQSPGTIKKTVLSTIDVAGTDRNAIKNLSWTLSQNAYKHLPDALLGKAIPQFFNSFPAGLSGYGTMGAIYGFR